MTEIDAPANDKRQFAVMDGNENVLGGSLSRDNAYIALYPEVLGKPVDGLEVGESTQARFSLSGATGKKARVYTIRRLEDRS